MSPVPGIPFPRCAAHARLPGPRQTLNGRTPHSRKTRTGDGLDSGRAGRAPRRLAPPHRRRRARPCGGGARHGHRQWRALRPRLPGTGIPLVPGRTGNRQGTRQGRSHRTRCPPIRFPAADAIDAAYHAKYGSSSALYGQPAGAGSDAADRPRRVGQRRHRPDRAINPPLMLLPAAPRHRTRSRPAGCLLASRRGTGGTRPPVWARSCSLSTSVRTRRRVASSTMGIAVAGRSARTPCFRCTMKRGLARRLAYQLRRPGTSVRYQRAPTR